MASDHDKLWWSLAQCSLSVALRMSWPQVTTKYGRRRPRESVYVMKWSLFLSYCPDYVTFPWLFLPGTTNSGREYFYCDLENVVAPDHIEMWQSTAVKISFFVRKLVTHTKAVCFKTIRLWGYITFICHMSINIYLQPQCMSCIEYRHTHTYIHTYTHTQIDIHKHTRTHSHTLARTHTYIHNIINNLRNS